MNVVPGRQGPSKTYLVSVEFLNVMMLVCETCKEIALRDVVLETSGKAATSSTCWPLNAGRGEVDDMGCTSGLLYGLHRADAKRLSESFPKIPTEHT